MKVQTRHVGDVTVAQLSGEIDTIDTDGLHLTFIDLVAARPVAVVLDFSGVGYIASMGLSLLVKLAKELRSLKCPLMIAGVTPPVQTILDTVRLGAMIPLDASVESAIAKVQSKIPVRA